MAADKGIYLTDGSRLYRVVSRFSFPPQDSTAGLEDCMTLEVRHYSPQELWDMNLRIVAGREDERAPRPRGAPATLAR